MGGNEVKFYSSLRLEVRRSAQIKQGDHIVGNRVKVKVVKNKVAPPFRTAEFDIMYNEGISRAGDVLDTAIAYGVISKSGNSYTYGEERLGVGRETAKKYLKDNPKLIDKAMKEVKEKAKQGAVALEDANLEDSEVT